MHAARGRAQGHRIMTPPQLPQAPASQSSHRVTARHALYNAFTTVAVQGLAILALPPSQYGVFAMYYLALALGTTVCFSVLSEAWSRTTQDQGILESWPRYCTMLTAICLATLIPVVVIAQFVGTWLIATLLGGAVAFSTYRTGARFYSAATGHNRLVGPADVAGGISVICLYFSFHVVLSPFEALSLAWFVSSVVVALMSERPRYESGYRPSHWIRDHWNAIRILMADSVLLDLGGVGVPFLLSPLLGIADFGVYRSVSSTAMPVRLTWNPLRPFISRRPLLSLATARLSILLAGGALFMGAATFIGLFTIHSAGLFSSGVILSLSSFALPVSLFVGFNFVSMFYYLLMRTHARGRRLMLYRVVQLLGAISFPLLGYYLSGLKGAIWGYALNAVFVCLLSAALVIYEVNTERARRPCLEAE